MRSFIFVFLLSSMSFAAELKVGDTAPSIQLKTSDAKEFSLESRRGMWTVLYFYPKAETPGCTKQACTFRDKIDSLRAEGADVFGLSSDNVDDLKKFKEHHKLNFTLVADPDSKAIKAYGTKMPVVGMSKRWTFIIDPNLKVAAIDKKVDPVLDADRMVDKLKELKKK